MHPLQSTVTEKDRLYKESVVVDASLTQPQLFFDVIACTELQIRSTLLLPQ